jgi:hypothetical protein
LNNERNHEPRPPEDIKKLIYAKKEWPAHVCEINSNLDLYRVAKDGNFMQNPLEEDFNLVKEKLLYLNEHLFKEKIKRFINSLKPQKILLIVGMPAVGKSTILLSFLDRCLEENLGDWTKIFFLNPIEEYLDETIRMGIVRSKIAEAVKSKLEEFPLEEFLSDTLLVVDGLYREGKHEVDKIFQLFNHVREEKFRLIATLRTHELEELKHRDEWREFVNLIIIEYIGPDKEAIRPILIKLIQYHKNELKPFMDFSDKELENFFKCQEFENIVQMIVNKSGGVIGYLAYLFKDLIRAGEFSKDLIKKYPLE